VRRRLLLAGGLEPLLAMVASGHPQVSQQAGTTLGVLTRFGGDFGEMLATDTPLLPSLVRCQEPQRGAQMPYSAYQIGPSVSYRFHWGTGSERARHAARPHGIVEYRASEKPDGQ
jgi:hypothetical protein